MTNSGSSSNGSRGAPQQPIPFNRPSITDKERQAALDALANAHQSGDGPYTRACSALLERALGTRRCLLTTSCTHALEMMGLLGNLEAGDEVVVPSFTFVSTANAFALRGAKVVFADIRPDTLNLDESRLEEVLTPRTRAVVVVHYAGVACEMDAIVDITRPRGIPIWEDNAHGLFGRYRGRNLGTLGAMSAQSFHETKNFSAGEGGALLLNDSSLIDRAEIIREKGTNRSRFFRGLVDKYSWVDLGSSYLPAELLAAVLHAQLERREEIQRRRRELWTRYFDALSGWAEANEVRLPHVPEHCEQTYHMFYVLLPSLEQRQDLMGYLRERSIHSVFHYLPLHLSEMGRSLGGFEGMCPVTESVSDRLLRLPMYTDLTDEDQDRVIDAVTSAIPAALRSSIR
ncbi:MAG TPA: dTDP-4-amino-4,6-dideoxygalactose transaminase [Gemmatimonadaceae bacterium]|nr:dTDP-4-amino-4,6-dideoxygalactose transaminase [Gemmatimonadaceae bacterium]